jgi:hypothetical protein
MRHRSSEVIFWSNEFHFQILKVILCETVQGKPIKSLFYMNWERIKMLQISLFGVSINIIGHIFFVFAQKNLCVYL